MKLRTSIDTSKTTDPFYVDNKYLDNALYSVRIVREYKGSAPMHCAKAR